MKRAPATGQPEGLTARRAMRSLGALPLLVASLFALAAPPAAAADAGTTHALLINGGSHPQANYRSHLHHLEEMVAVLEHRGVPGDQVHIFSADGEDEAPDLAARDPQPEGFWLIDDTRLDKPLRPRTEISDTRWPGVTLRPARKAALEAWFEDARETLQPGDRLLIFVTDHGNGNSKDPDNGTISLWEEKLSVDEFRVLLARLRPGVRVVMVMSQCFSGTFANAIYGETSGQPIGEACGFFSTTRDLQAYGCYPEGRDRDRIGHAFRFIDALDRHPTADAAHREVLITDDTPDVPLRTSDLYLERLLATAAETRGMELAALVDSLLAVAWRDRAAWEPEIRLLDRIGDTFGTFSPRSLAELEGYARELPPLIERMDTFADLWEAALVSVKQENLRTFVGERSEWRERLTEKALAALDADERRELLEPLLLELEWHARDRPEIWQRLEGFRDRARRASQARWRLEVRRAALSRMRSTLVAVAGRVLLAADVGSSAGENRWEAERSALLALETCEALEPGELPASEVVARAPAVELYPPLTAELELLEELLPSWLGVRFKAVPAALSAGRLLSPGATWLEVVYPDSPAAESGLATGDIVLGEPGRPFTARGQLREWTMTSPADKTLPLSVLRPGLEVEDDEELVVAISLRPYPVEWPELPGPPQVGELAPTLPRLEMVAPSAVPELAGSPRLLFFWATWCLPCKKAVPEVMAYAAAEGITVLAISDEDRATVAGYLEARDEAFFDRVAVDPLRKSFVTWGVSGTPTILVVDANGVVRHRQVGYTPGDGLTIEGWSWSQR